MMLHDWLTIVCSIGGFFGWYGVAHHTRLRGSACLFYVLSMFFAGNILATLKGDPLTAAIFDELIVCISAVAALTYAASIERYWRKL